VNFTQIDLESILRSFYDAGSRRPCGGQGLLTVTDPSDNLSENPAYSSEGTLVARTEERQWTGSTIAPGGEDHALAQMSNRTTQLFYFAGRPVAQLTSGPELLYLTTDHLGTPVLATDASGSAVWAGGVEPFGRTWTAGVDNPDPELAATRGGETGRTATEPFLGTLASEKVFLRYPGQWASDAFRVTGTQEEIYFNVHRWYGAGVGRYSQPDPLGLRGGAHLFSYAQGQPLASSDPLGLRVTNNTSCVIYVKESERPKTHALLPGETWPVEQDGYADPCKHPNEVFKSTDFVEITVKANHEPEITINEDMTPIQTYLGSKVFQSSRGGWKGIDWQTQLHSQKKQDLTWDDLFANSQPANCCCTKPK
jgi:RHS repeat-associated protein